MINKKHLSYATYLDPGFKDNFFGRDQLKKVCERLKDEILTKMNTESIKVEDDENSVLHIVNVISYFNTSRVTADFNLFSVYLKYLKNKGYLFWISIIVTLCVVFNFPCRYKFKDRYISADMAFYIDRYR